MSNFLDPRDTDWSTLPFNQAARVRKLDVHSSMVRSHGGRDGSNWDLGLSHTARNQSDVPKALCTGIRFPPQFQSLAPFLKRGSPQKGFEHMHFATCPI